MEGNLNEEINKAIEVLKSGGTILYPTDTIWGIGCDATNDEAVSKIFSIKQREESKSLIIMLDEETKLNKYVKDVPAVAWDLIEFSESPLTIIYPGAYNLARKLVNPFDGTIGIRITKDEFCRGLIRKFNRPIVSTSANISTEPSPAFFKNIHPEIISAVDYVVNLRQKETITGKPSSIIKVGLKGEIAIIRK